MNTFTINAETRGDLGKGASRRLRHAGKFPAVIYGGEPKPESLTLDHSEILKIIDEESFYTSILDIVIDGKASKAVVKDIQRHPYKPKVTHMDFQRVSEDQIIHMLVPIHFLGGDIAPGVKTGGQLTHIMSAIDVACKAKDIPEYIELDVSAMDVGDTLHISDLTLPEGVTSVELSHGEDHDQPVVAIQKSRGMKADEDEATEEAPEGDSE